MIAAGDSAGIERPRVVSAAYESTSPAVTVGPETSARKRIAGSRAAARGAIHPAWLEPARPTRARSTPGCAARNRAAAAASFA